MSGISWLLWLLSSAAVATLSAWHYRRRETPGRGRMLLALLRAAALALVLLLLFDPELPGRRAVGGVQVLLDASLSMRLPAESGATRWTEGVAAARARTGDRPVLLFGEGARPVAAAALPDTAPGDTRSRLLPALQAAAEAGARTAVVITDGALEDADLVARWLPRLGMALETVRIGAGVPDGNRAVVEARAPEWSEAGQPVPVEFGVGGGGTDSVRVVVRRDGRVLGRSTVPPPAAGRIAAGSVDVRLDPPPGGGWVRLEVALENGDAVPDDDVRTLYVQVGDEPAGVVLISFRPDWEPRFLAPTLATALGLPLRAWLRSATGQYVRLGAGLEAGVAASEADLRRAVGRAQLVVLHGLGVDAPDWAREAARTARHVLVFPADDSPDLPVPLGSELAGDFFAADLVPASPIAPLLADLETAGASPLGSVRQAEPPAGSWVALAATRGRQGQPVPLIVAGQEGARRWAVSLASGYWSWAFRGGSERQLYTRLWSALGGWLAQERNVAALPPVRPAAMAMSRGAAVPWIAPGIPADSVRVTVSDPDGAVHADTVLTGAAGDTLYADALPPGHYGYRAAAYAGDNVVEAEGVFSVERYSPELSRPAVDPDALRPPATAVRGLDDRPRGRPLHATALPWLVLVTLLASEWILRRRWGLR